MLDNTAQSDFIEALLSFEVSSSLIKSADNISIYQNNIKQVLLMQLTKIYPIAANIIGSDCFNYIASQYASSYPSISSNLNEYGEFFNVFISEISTTSHLTYLPDVAQFEWYHHVLHDLENHNGLDLSKLAKISYSDYDKIKFDLHPACKLFSSNYPLIEIIELGLGKSDKTINLDSCGVNLIIYRPDDIIKTVNISPEDYAFLDAISRDMTLSQSLENAIAINPEFLLEEKLPSWIKSKVIVDCRLA